MTARPIVYDDDLHASLPSQFLRAVSISTGLIGSPIPASVVTAAECGGPGVHPIPDAGAAAAFNLDACFTMVEPARIGEGA